MRKILWLLLLIPFFYLLFHWYDNYNITQQKENTIQISPSISVVPTLPEINTSIISEKKSIFIPYWNIPKDSFDLTYDSYYYFGVTANSSGIDVLDEGYKNLKTFSKTFQNKKKFLVVRLLNNDLNFQILDDSNLQQSIIDTSIATAKEYNFDGIVLDFEISAISFDNTIQKISTFVNKYGSVVHAKKLAFHITSYGDTFFRGRPFDIKSIAKISDVILIMTYDFHKSKGTTPGPTFPFSNSETYGYDFKKMLDDFGSEMPLEKLTIVFGMFGYDWVVDEQNRVMKNGIPITFSQAKTKFINNCSFSHCAVWKDPISFEIKITYTDEESQNHIVWIETEDSVNIKKQYALRHGIGGFSYWAYSYF